MSLGIPADSAAELAVRTLSHVLSSYIYTYCARDAQRKLRLKIHEYIYIQKESGKIASRALNDSQEKLRFSDFIHILFPRTWHFTSKTQGNLSSASSSCQRPYSPLRIQPLILHSTSISHVGAKQNEKKNRHCSPDDSTPTPLTPSSSYTPPPPKLQTLLCMTLLQLLVTLINIKDINFTECTLLLKLSQQGFCSAS